MENVTGNATVDQAVASRVAEATIAAGQTKGKRYLWLPNGVEPKGLKLESPFIFTIIAISQLVSEGKLKASDTPVAEGDQFAGEKNKNVGMYPVVTNDEETAEVVSLGGRLHQERKDADKKKAEARANQPKAKSGASLYEELAKMIAGKKTYLASKSEKHPEVKPSLDNLLMFAAELVALKYSGKVTDETVAELKDKVTLACQLAEMAILERMAGDVKGSIKKSGLEGEAVDSISKEVDEMLALANSEPEKTEKAKKTVFSLQELVSDLRTVKNMSNGVKEAIKKSGLAGSAVESISNKVDETHNLAFSDATKAKEAQKSLLSCLKDIQLMSHSSFIPKTKRGNTREEQGKENRNNRKGRRPDDRHAVVPDYSTYPQKG